MASARTVLLGVAIVAAPLLVGGVHTEVVVGLAALLAGGWVLGARSGQGGRIASVPSLAFVVLGLVSLAQLLPLPGAIHRWVDPTGHGLYVDGWRALFGEAPPGEVWRFLSLDPGETADRGLRWIALALGAGLGAGYARQRGGWERLARIVLGAGIAVTLVGALQIWLGAEQVLFVYEPSVPLPGATTFVSDNHAATFAGLAALAGFFLAFRAPGRRPLEGTVAAVAAIGLMVLMFEFGSAGTTIGFVVALGLFLVLFVGTRTAEESVPVEGVGTGIRAVGGGLMVAPVIVGAIFLWGPAGWRASLWQSHLGEWLQEKAGVRAEMVRAALEATGDFWLTGAGGGATGRVLPPYLDWSVVPPASVSTIENEPVEWLFQYGVPAGLVAGLLLLGYGWFLYRRYREHRRYRYAAGLSLALYGAVVAQFHFPFLTLGIALPAVVLLEGLAAPVAEEAGAAGGGVALDRERGVVAIGGRAGHAVLAGVLAAGVWFAGVWALYDVDLSQERPSSREAYERLVAWVPSDGDLYVRAALAAREAGDRKAAVRRSRHAFQREPTANVGIYAAQVCRWAGRNDDARKTYRRVFDGSFEKVPGRWIRYLVGDFPEPDDLAEILEGASESVWRTTARVLRRERGPEAAAQFGLALHEQRPEAFVPHHIVVKHYLQMDQALLAETWMTEIMGEVGESHPRRSEYVQLMARALRAQGKTEEATEVCERLEGWLARRKCRRE